MYAMLYICVLKHCWKQSFITLNLDLLSQFVHGKSKVPLYMTQQIWWLMTDVIDLFKWLEQMNFCTVTRYGKLASGLDYSSSY
jgi:hypothetical protein